MSSEAITRNDLTAILNEVLPPTPSEFRKLLWTNASPSSAFAAQTILSDVDLTEYDEFEIEVRNYITGDIYNICRFENASQRQIWVFDTSNFTGSTIPVQLSRIVNISSSGMAISNGYSKAYNSTSAPGNSSSICLPIKVYGIKYERVLPPAMDALEWKLAGTATGNNTVAMPTDYNEIMLVATGYSTYFFTAIVPKSEISSSNIAPRFASYYNASNNAGGYWLVNSSTASLGSYQENGGNNVLSQATFKLYYR